MGIADGLCVYERQSQHALDVATVKRIVYRIVTEMVYIGKLEVLALGNSQHFVAIILGQKFTFGIEELQCVPLTGIVAGRDDDTTIGLCPSDSQLGGRCGGQPDVDHIVAHAHERTAHNVGHHLA